MGKPSPILTDNDPALLQKLAFIERGYLAVVGLIAVGALAVRAVPALSRSLPGDWTPLTPAIAIAALFSALGLEFSRSSQPLALRRMGAAFASLLALLSLASLSAQLLGISAAAGGELEMLTGGTGADRMPALTAATFAALALVILLTPARIGVVSHAADLVLSFFCLLVLVMIRGYLLEGLSLHAENERTSLLTLLALALLAFVAFMHRAETGVFSSLLGAGSGSKIARIAAPIVLLIPFLPQAALSKAVKSGLIHPEYLSGIVAFTAAGVSLVVMLYMALKINSLEAKVRDLSLRDEATALHNRRGFHMVAWQALRQARRDGLPFSILFVELDNLAEVNGELGPHTTAEMLAEVAEILRVAFRATDVIGRIDPAQFAVAGHFDDKASQVMQLRLQEAVNYRNSNPGRGYSLAVSIHCVHARDPRSESLEDLLAEGDNSREREFPQAEHPAPAASRQDR